MNQIPRLKISGTRVVGLLGVLLATSSSGAALDLNDTESLDYYPSNQLEFRVEPDGTIQPRGDIELGGNEIDTSGSTITLRDSTNNQDILNAQEGGRVVVPNGGLSVPEGQIGARQGDNTNNPDSGIRFEGSNTDYELSADESKNLAFRVRHGGGTNLGNTDFSVFDTGKVRIPNGNLDVSGNNITNIDTLKFEKGTSIDGDLTIDGSTDITGRLEMSDDIDLSNNDLVEPDEIRTGGSGTDEIAIRDSSNSQDILQAQEGGDLQVPNGDIIAGTSGDDSSFKFESEVRFDTPSLSTARISALGGGNDNLFVLRDASDDLRVLDVGEEGPIDFRNPETGEDIVRLNYSGGSNVGIPNGNLSLGNNNLANTNTIQFSGNPQIGENSQATDADTTALGEFSKATGPRTTALGQSSEANSQKATALGRDSQATSSRATAVGENSQAAGGQATALGQASEANSQKATALGRNSQATKKRSTAIGQNSQATAEGAVAIGDRANAPNTYEATFGNLGSERLDVNITGKLTVHQNIDLQGNRLVDDTSSNTVYIGDGTDDNVRLETGGEDVDVPDGQVDVNSPSNTGRTLDVGGGVNADGDLKTFSGNVASDQRMCIGDRCA